MPQIYVTWQFLEASGPQGPFFEKKSFRNGIGKCVYQILFGHGEYHKHHNKPTDTYKQIKEENTIRMRHVDFDKVINSRPSLSYGVVKS